MDARAKKAALWATVESDAERVTFPEVVRALMEAGVERYQTDLVTSTKTYYTPEGGAETVPCHAAGAVARDFDPKAVDAAVRAIQARAIQYREFGRRAVYYGRTCDEHVEWFPGAEPNRS